MTQERKRIAAQIDAFYEAISGSAERKPDLTSLAALFASGASILPHRQEESQEALSVDEYVDRLRRALADRNFYERGIDYRIEIHGDIAQVWSRYEASEGPSFSEISKHGTNLVQLIRDEGVWKISSMLYRDD